MYQARST